MQKNKLVGAGLGLVLAFGLSAGAGLAQAAPSTGARLAETSACAAAKQQVSFAQARVSEATTTRGDVNKQVNAQKSSRQTAINAGDVASVSRINVQLGSSTAMYNTMDSAVTVAQAQVVQNQAAKKAAC